MLHTNVYCWRCVSPHTVSPKQKRNLKCHWRATGWYINCSFFLSSICLLPLPNPYFLFAEQSRPVVSSLCPHDIISTTDQEKYLCLADEPAFLKQEHVLESVWLQQNHHNIRVTYISNEKYGCGTVTLFSVVFTQPQSFYKLAHICACPKGVSWKSTTKSTFIMTELWGKRGTC